MSTACVFVVHGIGDHKEGWLDKERVRYLLNLSPDFHVFEYSYEGEFENDWHHKLLMGVVGFAGGYYGGKAGAKAGEAGYDYLSDWVRFRLSKNLRSDIVQPLIARVKKASFAYDKVYLIGHSLGSVVSYLASLKLRNENIHLITLGSPLSKWVVRKTMKDLKEKKEMKKPRWLNVYNHFDPVSGKIKDFGILPENEISFASIGDNPHSLYLYLEQLGQSDRCPTV